VVVAVMVEILLRPIPVEQVKRVEAMVEIPLPAVVSMFQANKVLGLALRQLQILVAAAVVVSNQAHKEVVLTLPVVVMAALV